MMLHRDLDRKYAAVLPMEADSVPVKHDWLSAAVETVLQRSIRHSQHSGVPVSCEQDVASSIRSAPTERARRAIWEHHTVTSNDQRQEHFGALQIHVSTCRDVGRRDVATAGRRATIERVSVVLCRD